MPPTPKFWPTLPTPQFYGPMLSTPPTPKFRPNPRYPRQKLYGPTPLRPKFQITPPASPTPKFYGPTLPMPPTPKFDPRHPRTRTTHATHEPAPPTRFSRLYFRFFRFPILTTNKAIQLFHLNLFSYWKYFSIILSFLSYSLGKNKFE